MHRVTGRAERVVMEHEPVAGIFLDELARREMVLEIDNHRGVSFADLAAVLAQVLPNTSPCQRHSGLPRFRFRSRPVTYNPMGDFMSHVAVPIAIGAVAVVLLLGLINMMRGGSPNKSQQLMRLRVLLQFVAIVVIMLTLWIMAR